MDRTIPWQWRCKSRHREERSAPLELWTGPLDFKDRAAVVDSRWANSNDASHRVLLPHHVSGTSWPLLSSGHPDHPAHGPWLASRRKANRSRPDRRLNCARDPTNTSWLRPSQRVDAPGDGDQVADRDVPGTASLGGGQVPVGDEQPQATRMDLELQGGRKFQRLTVDAGVSLAGPRPDLEVGCGELVPVPAPAALAQCREGKHLGRLAPGTCRDGNNPERSGVQPPALRCIEGRAHDVGIIGHLDHEGTVYLDTTWLGELEVEWFLCTAQHLGQHGLGGLRLGFSVPLLLHDRGIDAEGHIVDEESVSHGGVVDAAFDAVAKGMEAEPRILPVDPEIQSEVVSRPRRNANKREIGLDGDGGGAGLGAITTGPP